MKIMFATEDKGMGSKIAKRFGHAPYYIIYETQNKTTDVKVNHGHDENHSSLIDLMDEGVTHFIVGNIEPNAFDVLKKRNVKIYLARKSIVKDTLKELINNTLEVLFEPTLKRS